MDLRDTHRTGATDATGTTDHRREGHDSRGPGAPTAGDRLAASWAVFRLEGWLEWYAVPGRTGRAMRRELRANLLEAAGQPGGVRGAVGGLSTRELAREAVVDTGGPRWGRGATAAVVAFVVVVVAQLVLSAVYADGLLQAGGGSGRLLGNEVSAGPAGDGIAVSTVLGGWSLLLVPVVFVLVSQPWRLLRRTRQA